MQLGCANDLDNCVMGIWQFLVRRFNAPDFASIFADSAITGKFAAASDVVDRHLEPFGLILTKNKLNVLKYVAFCH